MAFLKPGTPIPTKGKGSKLSGKMKLFCEEYVIDMHASNAVVRAGYKTDNPNRIGTELKNHPLCVPYIEELLKPRRERMAFSADYLLEKLMNIISDESIRTSDQLRAIELAGKSIALWKDRQEISGVDGEAIKMEQLQRVEEDIDEFTNQLQKLKRIASSDAGEDASGGAGAVLKFVKPGS